MTNKDEQYNKELELARQMKENYCDELGKETNPAKAAEIIHRIGLIYRNRSPDKMSLIKSVGLLNAAIIRSPSNILQIKSDLFEICQHILQQAKAKNQNADLIEKAKQVKLSVNDLRNEVNKFLGSSMPYISNNVTKTEFQELISDKISKIQYINKIIASKYKHIMADISQFCEDALGKPPCQYAIVGMGSLAREEITPYSDFEHIILLSNDKNYKSYLNYFKWFSVIFHVVVLNLQETIIPSLDVYSLRGKDSNQTDTWYYDVKTPRGISFDGMMPHACKFPIGRQTFTTNKQFTTELIKPVSKMLEYLSSEADLQNGYHLADILTKTCFVFGDENIFKQFVVGTQNHRDKKSQPDIIIDVQKQVKDDLDRFSTRFQLSKLNSQDNINVKQIVYRSTTIFIAALARIYNVSANSCFEIITAMKNNKQITGNAAQKLQTAIAIACEMRLKVYMKNKSQCDNVIVLKHSNDIKNFLDIVGVASTISYFQIAYCLQCEVAKQLNFTKLHFYSNPQLINITIGLAFGIKNWANTSTTPHNQFWKANEFDFDACIGELEVETKLSENTENHARKISNTDVSHFQRNDAQTSNTQTQLNIEKTTFIANELFSAKVYDEAMDFYIQLLNIYRQKTKNIDRDHHIADSNHKVGVCWAELNKQDEALNYLYRALEIKQNATLKAEKDTSIAMTLHEIGSCHIYLHNYDETLKYLNRALEIEQNATLNAEKDTSIATTLHEIGRCHIRLHNYDEALKYLNRALEIDQNATLNAEKDTSIAATLHEIGRCHIYLHKYDEALNYLNKALEIDQNATLNAEKDTNIATTLHYIGRCHIDLHNYDETLKYLNRTLEIKQNATLSAEKDTSIAITLHEIGRCHIDLHNYDEALKCLNRALEIEQNATLNAEEDTSIATTLHSISRCHIDLHNYDEALKYLNRALEINQNATRNAEKDCSLAITQRSIGRCLLGLQQIDNSWNCFENSLKILQNTTIDEGKDVSIAITFHCMGDCLFIKQCFAEALAYLQRALKIYKSSNTNAEKNARFGKALCDTGRCLMELQEYSNALLYFKKSLEVYENFPRNEQIAGKIALTRSYIDECVIKLG